MFVTRLSLSQFRNHGDAVIAPGPSIVVLTGENGAGKTNVLEAVSLLAPGRGLRGATLSEIARKEGPGGFGVAARLRSDVASPDDVEIGTGTTSAAPERRQVRINGATSSATSLAEWVSLLWLTPAMDRLFSESASGRRRFLDRLVLALEPGHAGHAARYEAAMRARNKLLGDAEGADRDWLNALEAAMAEHGTAVAEARERALTALSTRLEAQPESPFARAALALGGWGPEKSDAQTFLAAGLRRGRDRDAAAGRTLLGPHRTDLLVTHVGKGQPAELCSTGEQKALLLAIILAHADLVAERVGRRPILLLDEVAAHLDPRRRAALFARLSDAGGQVWATGTERSLFEGAGSAATWLRLADGKLLPDD